MSLTIQEFFKIGLKRDLPELLPNHGAQIELGPGKTPMTNCYYLDKNWNGMGGEDWDANCDSIPFIDETVNVIHAYHILEHVNDPVGVLQECQRVLVPGGHINIVVPHWKCELAFEDITHQHRFAEGTWDNILNNQGYDNTNGFKWKLKVHVNFIMGIVERNTAIFTQLLKVE